MYVIELLIYEFTLHNSCQSSTIYVMECYLCKDRWQEGWPIAVIDKVAVQSISSQSLNSYITCLGHCSVLNIWLIVVILVSRGFLCPVITVANAENNGIRIEKNNVSGHILTAFLSHSCPFLSRFVTIFCILHRSRDRQEFTGKNAE